MDRYFTVPHSSIHSIWCFNDFSEIFWPAVKNGKKAWPEATDFANYVSNRCPPIDQIFLSLSLYSSLAILLCFSICPYVFLCLFHSPFTCFVCLFFYLSHSNCMSVCMSLSLLFVSVFVLAYIGAVFTDSLYLSPIYNISKSLSKQGLLYWAEKATNKQRF